MPVFTYSARALTGELQSGEIELPSREEVVGYLRRQRLVPVAVKAKPKDISISFGTGVKMREVVIFTRQFSTMIAAGLPLVQSLSILAEQTENPKFATIITAVLNDIQAGQTLPDSMKKHPEIFSDLY